MSSRLLLVPGRLGCSSEHNRPWLSSVLCREVTGFGVLILDPATSLKVPLRSSSVCCESLGSFQYRITSSRISATRLLPFLGFHLLRERERESPSSVFPVARCSPRLHCAEEQGFFRSLPGFFGAWRGRWLLSKAFSAPVEMTM
jgi:hypothetical protein